jgi:phosphoribosylanthranilate isomerase
LLSLEAARVVLGPRRHTVRRVAVFGEQNVSEIRVIADELDLDVIQLHGTQTLEAVAHLAQTTERTVWPVLRVDGTTLPGHAVALARATGHLVLDAHVVGQLGGTGVALDWSGLRAAVASLRQQVPSVQLILAGGLRPANVAQAIQLLSPQVVDVSSGVEAAPGVKDPALVQQFVRAVHGAAETQQ